MTQIRNNQGTAPVRTGAAAGTGPTPEASTAAAAAATTLAKDAYTGLNAGKAPGAKADDGGFLGKLGSWFNKAKDAVGDFFGKVAHGFKTLVFGKLNDLESRETLDNPSSTHATRAELNAARDFMTANAAKEAEAVAALGARKADYEKIKQLCGDDPMAQKALMAMLLDGRLTGGKDLKGGQDMLHHLARMGSDPVAAGVDRKALVTNVIEEMENSLNIAQHGKGTCVATSATIMLVRQNPTEYARLIADLASPAGKTTLQNGAELERETDWAKDDGDYDPRTPSVRLLQPALMEYGNFFMDYDNGADANRVLGLKLGGGLNTAGADRLLEGLTGKDFDNIFVVTRFNRESAWNRIEESLAAGKSVPVSVHWQNLGSSGHQIILDKIEGEWVHFTNPWGQSERVKLSEIKANLSGAQIPE